MLGVDCRKFKLSGDADIAHASNFVGDFCHAVKPMLCVFLESCVMLDSQLRQFATLFLIEHLLRLS